MKKRCSLPEGLSSRSTDTTSGVRGVMARRGASRYQLLNMISLVVIVVATGRLVVVMLRSDLVNNSKSVPGAGASPSGRLSNDVFIKGDNIAMPSDQAVATQTVAPKIRDDSAVAAVASMINRKDIPEDLVQWGVGKRVLIFTMDSLNEAVEKADRGGASGEIIIRESLTSALREAGVQVDIATSDRDFERKASITSTRKYDGYALDPWTWASKGKRLKAELHGKQGKMVILDFFGSELIEHRLGVPAKQYLTAFPVVRSKSFLGYRIDDSQLAAHGTRKKRQGVIWGKNSSFAKGNLGIRSLVAQLSSVAELHATVEERESGLRGTNVVYHGHLSRYAWHQLLQESKFLIGLGDPLSGPSAVDAVVAGCMYINPVYARPQKGVYQSQHPYLADSVGEPYVCNYDQHDADGAERCIRKALEQDLQPLVPAELTKTAHAFRVWQIFEPLLQFSLS